MTRNLFTPVHISRAHCLCLVSISAAVSRSEIFHYLFFIHFFRTHAHFGEEHLRRPQKKKERDEDDLDRVVEAEQRNAMTTFTIICAINSHFYMQIAHRICAREVSGK